MRSEIADSLGDKDAARAELEAVPLEDVPLPSVLETYYERADALYRELDDRDALVAAARRLAEHPALDADAHLRFARAAVRAMVHGLLLRRGRRRARARQAPPDSELAFAVELGRAVETIRVEEPPPAVREALVALYRRQKRHDRQRAIILDAVQRASRLEAEKLVEALAQLYVDDVPRGTQERRRAERLFERVMLSRAYRRLGKGHLDAARDTFRTVADTTGSLEAHVGYVDVRMRQGATARRAARGLRQAHRQRQRAGRRVRARLPPGARAADAERGRARKSDRRRHRGAAPLGAGAARQARAARGVGRASCTSATSTTASSPRRRRRTCTTCWRSSWWRAIRAIARMCCRSWR